MSDTTDNVLTARQQAELAKRALREHDRRPHQVAAAVQQHPWAAVVASAAGGFLLAAFRPGRTLIHQALRVGAGIAFRQLLKQSVQRTSR
jgi:hypothetical protein